MIDAQLLRQLTLQDGYAEVQEIEGHGICGINRFIYTTGLVMRLDSVGYTGRYCYHTYAEARAAINMWDGRGDPPGEWIKYKGKGGERSHISDPYENNRDVWIGG